MIRIFHTADWHLGHSLHGLSRDFEHREFLHWLLVNLEEREADVLMICGDVFDSANPPASAQAMFYRFVVEAKGRCPKLQIIVTAGNHDSPARLEAPRPLLAEWGVHVVGAFVRDQDGAPDRERLIVPLRDGKGETAALCVALPYLRPCDLPAAGGEDSLVEGVRRIYAEASSLLHAVRRPGQTLVATGHCYVTGASLSELSERRILGGNQHALPVDIFSDSFTYAALGHLHLAQKVGGRPHVRYSGSPIPLSMAEDRYPHQVVEVDMEGDEIREVRPLTIPRSVEILRLPAGKPLPPAEVLQQLKKLDLPDDLPRERHPLLEIAVLLERPEPGLRHALEGALEGKPVRLLKVGAHYPGGHLPLADALPELRLQQLHPDEVFIRRYRQRHETDPPDELLSAFHELVESVREGGR